MNKDVIYIDVEDDITAIIGKVKDAKQKIVALVPPKRIGVLQSAVNLHLLARAAGQSDKRLVLISNNSALMALASAAKIPVAKTLQSKPELAEVAALDVDDGEDVIDGAKLPVGELARTADSGSAPLSDPTIDEAIRENAAEQTPKATPPAPGALPPKPKAKKGPKVPNFNKFRKKMVLIAGGGVLLVAFLVWAIFFAPRATVVIAAQTTTSSMNTPVTLSEQAPTDLSSGTIKATKQTLEKDVNTSFEATGTKDVGEKATGTVVFSTDSISRLGTVIPAGTELTTSEGTVFVTDESVTMTTNNYSGASTGVTAAESGSKYNGASGDVSGAPSGINASLQGSTAGGTDKTVAVATEEDIQNAKAKLAEEETDEIKQQLKDKFGDGAVIIESTFKTDGSDVESSVEAGKEAPSGKAQLTGEVNYSMVGVEKAEISRYLDAFFKKRLEGEDNQRVYDNGVDTTSFTNVESQDEGFRATITATAKVGPKINDQEIKDTAKGKRYGEIQSAIEAIKGVNSVDIKFWPFWVSTAPNDTDRISVEFKLDESK